MKKKNKIKMQVKGALKKANSKVAMGLPSTARYSAYIALLLKLVAMGLLSTARYSAYIALLLLKVGSKGFA